MSENRPWYELCSFEYFDRKLHEVIICSFSTLNVPPEVTKLIAEYAHQFFDDPGSAIRREERRGEHYCAAHSDPEESLEQTGRHLKF